MYEQVPTALGTQRDRSKWPTELQNLCSAIFVNFKLLKYLLIVALFVLVDLSTSSRSTGDDLCLTLKFHDTERMKGKGREKKTVSVTETASEKDDLRHNLDLLSHRDTH